MKKLLSMGRRKAAALLAILMIIAYIPFTGIDARAEEAGSFSLFVLTENQTVIAPVQISYAESETVRQAIDRSSYTFTYQANDGFITAIEGVTDNYVIHYDNDGYDLDAPASGITGMWITTKADQAYSASLLSLVKLMAQTRTAEDGRAQYPAVESSLERCVSGFYQADGTAADTLLADLNSAIDEFNDYNNRGKAKVTFNVYRGDAKITPAVAAFTDTVTGITKTVKSKTYIMLGEGTYSFEISDKLNNHIRGSYTVTGTDPVTFNADLPAFRWVESISAGIVTSWTEALPSETVSDYVTRYLIPDYAGPNIFPYAVPASGTNTTNVGIYLADSTYRKNWQSTAAAFTKVLEKESLEGNTLTVEARQNPSADTYGYEQYQTYQMELVRTPSLANLSARSDGVSLNLGFENTVKEYHLTVTGTTVSVKPELLCEGSLITVNGSEAENGKSLSVKLADLTQVSGEYLLPVQLTAPSGVSTEYDLYITKESAVTVTLNRASGVSVEVTNVNDEVLRTVTSTDTESTYRLIPGETYTWTTTKDTWYHAQGSFTAAKSLTITTAAPKKADWLKEMAARAANSASSAVYPTDSAFTASDHTYTFTVPSTNAAIYLHALALNASDYTVTAKYTTYKGTYTEKVLGTAATAYTSLASLFSQSGNASFVRLTVSEKAVTDGVTYYQDYELDIARQMLLNTLSVTDEGGSSYVLSQSGSGTAGFDKTVTDYTIKVPRNLMTLNLKFKVLSSSTAGDNEMTVTAGIGDALSTVTFSEENLPSTEQLITLALDTQADEETALITVAHTDELSLSTVYRVKIEKLPPVNTTINVSPSDATVFLTDPLTGNHVYKNENGIYELNDSTTYSYNITAKGYVGISGSFTASESNKSLSFTLTAAAASSFTDLSAEDDWPSFRGNDENNGLTSYLTPIRAEDAVLVWANKIGEGYGSGATGCPILVGNYLYTYAGTKLVKVDKNNGNVAASGDMIASSSFAINSPTYAEGLIFVGLSGGRVQAFNAETLESVWLYTDALGGQPNCPIAYNDGYVYTGFWNSETKKANFVCISVTDEDPSQKTESKLPTWTVTDNGFYWAGAYVCDDFLLITTDDGDSGYITGKGSILSLDPVTGKTLDRLTASGVGDLRSSICYDRETNAYYFTSKGGDFYQVKVNADGTFKSGSLKRLHLYNYANDDSAPPMSTSTPVIYKGRAYIGVSGTGQFTAYSGHNMTVIDLASFTIAYTIPTQGYPQTSGLLTTAYEDTGYIYVYFIDNYTPGKIRIIRDRAGRTEADHDFTTTETYTVNGVTKTIETGYVLFTPNGSQAQYAICSPICDSEGNLYFKNDSAQLMKLANAMTSLTVTKAPDKTVYAEGEVFDPAGMTVTAQYANGTMKDVTDLISFASDPITAEDKAIVLSIDTDKLLNGSDSHWQFYQDKNGTPGTAYRLPTAYVNITVGNPEEALLILSEPSDFSGRAGTKASFTVKASGFGLTYQWYYSKSGKTWYKTGFTGYDTETLTVPITDARNGYQYRCVITDANGNTATSNAAVLTVEPEEVPVELTVSADVTASVGDNAVFTVTLTGASAASYQWYYSKTGETWNKTSLTGNTTDTLTVAATSGRNGYQYRCKVTLENGTVMTSDAARLTVNVPASVKSSGDVTVKVGETAVFSVTATGEVSSYQWYYRKTAESSWCKTTLNGCKTDTLSFAATAGRNGYQYRCKVSFVDGTVKYTSARTLTVTAAVENSVRILGDSSGLVGTRAPFSVVTTGEVSAYKWYYRKNAESSWYSTTFSGYTSDTLSVLVSQERDGYQYRCKVTFADGTVLYSEPATLHVDNGPVITVSGDVTCAAGQTAVFQVSADKEVSAYQWYYCSASGSTWYKTSLTGNTRDTLSVLAKTTRNGYRYRCELTFADGSTYVSDPCVLTVN